MQRLRSTWMALIGGILLVTLSISAAFGAPPSGDDAPRGQTVAGFVHELVFAEEAPDEEPQQEEEEEQEEELEEELEEQQLNGEESDSHGACVSEVAHDKAGENDPEDAEYANHGERVSEAARFLCWGFEVGADEDPEAEEEEEEEESDAGSTTTAGPGRSGDAGAHGKANAPGQQQVRASAPNTSFVPAAARGGGNGNGNGQGRGGR
jgi:hypothetical protein